VERLRATLERRGQPLETEEEWLRRNDTTAADLAAAAAEGEAAGRGQDLNATAEGDWNESEWVDIRTVNFTAAYTEEYGSDWLREYPDSPAAYRRAAPPRVPRLHTGVHSLRVGVASAPPPCRRPFTPRRSRECPASPRRTGERPAAYRRTVRASSTGEQYRRAVQASSSPHAFTLH
jgi:hypothetical protein